MIPETPNAKFAAKEGKHELKGKKRDMFERFTNRGFAKKAKFIDPENFEGIEDALARGKRRPIQKVYNPCHLCESRRPKAGNVMCRNKRIPQIFST
jgi:hypothetical protein